MNDKSKKKIINKTIFSAIFTFVGYLIIFMMYSLINKTPKTDGINYGAIIYIFMLVVSGYLIFHSLYINVIMIYTNIKEIRNSEKDMRKPFIICLVINILLLILNIFYFIMIDSKILLKK